MNLYMVSVGISNYDIEGVNNLPPCVHDARGIVQALLPLHTPIDTHVTLLLDEDATKANIYSALHTIATNATAEDRFIFYYSGHGAQFATQSDNPIDHHAEEFLCPIDIRSLLHVDNMIQDDELSAWIAPIRTKAREVILIIDSCYSGDVADVAVEGTFSRLVAKSLPASVLVHIDKRPSKTHQLHLAEATEIANHLLLAASQENQRAFIAEDESHSLFTGVLLEVLAEHVVTTFQAWFEEAEPQVTRLANQVGEFQNPLMVDGIGHDVLLRF